MDGAARDTGDTTVGWSSRRYRWVALLVGLGLLLAVGQFALFSRAAVSLAAVVSGLAVVGVGLGGVVVLSQAGTVVERRVTRPAGVGFLAVALGGVTLTLAGVLSSPPAVVAAGGVFPVAVGVGSLVVGVRRWAVLARKRRETLREQERHSAAQRAELRRRVETMESFAGVVSHDLRNPIEVARGHLDLLRAATDGDQTDEIDTSHLDGDHLGRIDSALGRMEEIIDDALALARVGPAALDTEETPLRDSVTAAWEGVDTGEATLSVSVPAEAVVIADETYLRRLFENLFRNAVEHVGPEPTVTVTAGDGQFVVEDDGPGIPEDRRESVTEPGHTTADDGTGFGLAIVDRVASAHGWRLHVGESSAGGGLFRVERVEFVTEDDGPSPSRPDDAAASDETVVSADGSGDWAGGEQ
jgi:signal transduction histidine kinase